MPPRGDADGDAVPSRPAKGFGSVVAAPLAALITLELGSRAVLLLLPAVLVLGGVDQDQARSREASR
jgi:hypothetical protein